MINTYSLLLASADVKEKSPSFIPVVQVDLVSSPKDKFEETSKPVVILQAFDPEWGCT